MTVMCFAALCLVATIRAARGDSDSGGLSYVPLRSVSADAFVEAVGPKPGSFSVLF